MCSGPGYDSGHTEKRRSEIHFQKAGYGLAVLLKFIDVYLHTTLHNSIKQKLATHNHNPNPNPTMSDQKVTIIDGKAVAQTIRSEIAAEVSRLSQTYGKVSLGFA